MRRRRSDDPEAMPAVDMTPMIDCTFNLLIFFLCNVQFRELEGRLPFLLPRDRGLERVAVERLLEPLAIDVARRVEVDTSDPAWTWDERQLAIRVQGRATSGLAELHRVLREARSRDASTRVLLRPARGTLYVDSVKVLNECLRARCTDVLVQGAPAGEE